MSDYRGIGRLDVFVRYCMARYNRDQVLFTYRTYVTNSLQLLPQNKYIKDRWCDLVKPKEEIDAQEVINDVISRSGLVMV